MVHLDKGELTLSLKATLGFPCSSLPMLSTADSGYKRAQ